ncbi:MAG: D-allose ABC transporter permease [Propioniciclava sp.]
MTQKTTGMESFQQLWSRYSTFIILVLIFVVFSALEPRAFLSGNNLLRIFEQSSITILLAVGEFFAILLAGIDLSVGSVMALTGVVAAQLMVLGIPWPIALLLGCVLLGSAIGALNGWLINLTNLPPFVITLGTMAIFRGLTYVVSDARAVSGLPPGFSAAIGGKLFGFLAMPIVIALVFSLFLVFFTVKTKPGRNLYAMGGNPQAAWYAGINLKSHTLLAFTLSGLAAGLAGMVNVARLGAAEPNAGTGYELFAIAAVIIGGTSFFGGEGKIHKVVIGGLIIGTINNGLNMVGVSAYYQQVAMGALIVLAVTLDRFFGSSSKR